MYGNIINKTIGGSYSSIKTAIELCEYCDLHPGTEVKVKVNKTKISKTQRRLRVRKNGCMTVLREPSKINY
jgi:hypothetical protein